MVEQKIEELKQLLLECKIALEKNLRTFIKNFDGGFFIAGQKAFNYFSAKILKQYLELLVLTSNA